MARSSLSPGEAWISFLRGYGPISRNENMYAETIHALSRYYGVDPLKFAHPLADRLQQALNPSTTSFRSVILTGTAGDGKTTLCNEVLYALTGDRDRIDGTDSSDYRAVEIDTPEGRKTIHFLFEFSGWAPEGAPWASEKLDLLDRFAAAVLDGAQGDIFIIAANDGKLVQAWDSIPKERPSARLSALIEELLTRGVESIDQAALLFLNLSRIPSATILELALNCLLDRTEWACFESEREDPAFSAASPLRRNYALLQVPEYRARLLALAELFDASRLHVPIREALALLVNGLLGHSGAADRLMRPAELRQLTAAGRGYEAGLHRNLFGANLSERRREQFAVYRYLAGFRVGLETNNAIDSLLVFGADDPPLQADHHQYLGSDPFYARDPDFERLRKDYLEAEDDRRDGEDFVQSLVHERRRLFMRLPDVRDARYDPWQLTVFQSAGTYRRRILEPTAKGSPVDSEVVAIIVCGLNRIWTGMLAGKLDRLYLSTGLDFSSARVSDIQLHEIPLRPNFHGEGVSVVANDTGLPLLRVSLGRSVAPVDFALHLTRFEFLTRVAAGALPSSFSRECYEDVLAFKSRVMSAFYALNAGQHPQLAILTPGQDGAFVVRQLNLFG